MLHEEPFQRLGEREHRPRRAKVAMVVGPLIGTAVATALAIIQVAVITAVVAG